jgi:UDP-N-acetylmuramate dehydrogenase
MTCSMRWPVAAPGDREVTDTKAVERAAALLGERGRRNVPLGPLTTYKVGGAAALFVEAAGDEDLALVAAAVAASGLPVLVIGKGSNLLVADRGFPGIAVVLGDAYESIEVEGRRLRVGGGASLPLVARRAAAEGLTGLEWAVGVPGSVGGAVRMNAGGHGSDMRSVLEGCRVFDLADAAIEELSVGQLHYGYRRSAIQPTHVVVSAILRADHGSRRVAEAAMAEVVRWRREHQPGGRNAGSVFTNPEGDSAGRLVEASGCKGRRVGSAQVSAKHANFIQADDGGSADDVLVLIGEVAAEVERRVGVRLDTEIRLIGFPGTYPQVVNEAEQGRP